jgi:hypothetical protein
MGSTRAAPLDRTGTKGIPFARRSTQPSTRDCCRIRLASATARREPIVSTANPRIAHIIVDADILGRNYRAQQICKGTAAGWGEPGARL